MFRTVGFGDSIGYLSVTTHVFISISMFMMAVRCGWVGVVQDLSISLTL